MKARTVSIMVLTVILLLSISACGGQATQTPEATLAPVVDTSGVTAEGKLVPFQYVNLSFNQGGKVTELEVKEGDTIGAGQVIARLDNGEQLASAVANAEVEQLNAQQALDVLQENAAVNTALAQQAVVDAQDAVREAERYINNLKKGSRQTDIDSARADVMVLEDRLEEAREEYDRHNNNNEDRVAQAGFLSKLADAQRKYDDAVRMLNNIQGDPSELDMAIAEADLAVAQAQLAINQQKYAELQNGPDPDDLAAAQARARAAEAALAAAQAALDKISLVAPFGGTVADLQLKLGEQVSPGVVVVTLADFSKWVVETDDLTEIYVPRVSLGQTVSVAVDALPEVELSGVVDSIGDVFEEKRGDVTYTVRVVLNDVDPRLRWGMTTVVTFEE